LNVIWNVCYECSFTRKDYYMWRKQNRTSNNTNYFRQMSAYIMKSSAP
jgi:DNA modification methylase